MAREVVCVFCGERRLRGKEHMIPRWLQVFIGGSTADHYMGSHVSLMPVARISRRDQPGESAVFGHVCRDCNNGWMSALESTASRPLKDAITNGPSAATWNSEQCQVVARWAFKTAAMINAGSNYRRIIPASHLRYFFDNEKPPPGVVVDIGLSPPPAEPTLEWRQSQDFLIFCPSGSIMWQLDRWRSYKITLAIGQLFVKVMFWPDPSCTLLVDKDEKAARIWPYREPIAFDRRRSDKAIDGFDFGAVVYPVQVLTG